MKHYRFPAFLLLAVLLCLSVLTACGEKTPDIPAPGTDAIAKEPASFADVYSAVTAVLSDADKLVDVQDSYLKNFIKADPENFANLKVVVQSLSSSIDEIGLFEVKDAGDVKAAKEMVEAYLDFYKNEIWDDRYIKEEFPKLRDAECVVCGNFILYTILDEATRASAIAAFENAAK